VKRFFAVLLVLAAGSVSAVDWKSYPEAIADDFVQIHFGVGMGHVPYGSVVIPPLIASADFNLPIEGIPFTLGGIFGLTTSHYQYSADNVNVKYDITGMGFGIRFGYHPNFEIKNLDAYANVELGYYIVDVKYASPGSANYPVSSGVLLGANVGARYFFTQTVGVFAELGYSVLTVGKIGLALKF
jgi:hypothetical protein